MHRVVDECLLLLRVCLRQEVGYQHGKTVFEVWQRSGVVEKMLMDHHQEEFSHSRSRNHVRPPGSAEQQATAAPTDCITANVIK